MAKRHMNLDARTRKLVEREDYVKGADNVTLSKQSEDSAKDFQTRSSRSWFIEKVKCRHRLIRGHLCAYRPSLDLPYTHGLAPIQPYIYVYFRLTHLKGTISLDPPPRTFFKSNVW